MKDGQVVTVAGSIRIRTISRVLTMTSNTHVSGAGVFAMLKANVGLSRKITRDFNSTGYSVNLEGEILASTDDAEAVTEKVKELFNLAQEALDQEINRDQGEDAIGRRDEERPAPLKSGSNGSVKGNGHTAPTTTVPPQQPPTSTQTQSQPASKPVPSQSQPTQQNGNQNGTGDAATNKQVQFLLNMGKRLRLTTPQLEGRMNEIIGRRCGVYDLTKKEAGVVLDRLTNLADGSVA
jgi:hypothetical protein